MPVRKATEQDATEVAVLVQEMHELATGEQLRWYDFIGIVNEVIDSDVVLVSETDGKLGGVIAGKLVGGVLLASALQEILWYARDGSGVRLMLAFVQAARDAGVEQVNMTVLESAGPKAMAFIERLGGVQVERNFIMKV